MNKSLEQLTLEELTAHSAKLYEQFYALKAEIQATKQWRNRRAIESDAIKAIAEAQARLNEAGAITIPPMVIEAESIKSDEAVMGTGQKVKQWIIKAFR